MKRISWERAKDLIAELLAAAPADREALLTSRCADATLRGEIRSFLRAFDAGAGEPLIDDEDDLAFGSYIGPYVVLEKLPGGGMGRVYVGNDPRLDRKVALKCLRSTVPGSHAEWTRILREARAAGRINHPNIATIHDVIEHETRAYIVMEYVEGESLFDHIKRERLPIETVLTIGRQLAAGLAAAHGKGVVHRDLKPTNVHLTPDGTPKILDFGIARATMALSSWPSTSSQPSANPGVTNQAGTPGYMPPEQLLGQKVDERSDIFSLGVVLYEMATGRAPFTTLDATELLKEMLAPVTRADIVDPNVPGELADIIATAMAIDPARRFQSAADVQRALNKLIDESRPRVLSWALVGSLWGAAALITVTLAGAITTLTHNFRLGNSGFSSESVLLWPYWGARVMVAPVILAGGGLALGFAVVNLLIAGPLKGVRGAFLERLRAVPSTTVNNALLALQAITIVALAWSFSDLIDALLIRDSTQVTALAQATRNRYEEMSSLALFVFGAAWYSVLKKRLRQPERGGTGALIGGGIALALTVCMLAAPWRVSRFTAERVTYDAERCYFIAQRANDVLIFCRQPPFNRVIVADDPRLRREHVIENIFSGIGVHQ